MEMIVVEDSDSLLHIELAGRLDVEGVAAIDTPFTSLSATRDRPAIVDLSHVSFMGSLGMRLLISCDKALRRKNAKMILLSPQELVAATLRGAGMDSLMTIVSSLEQAKALLQE